MRLDLALSDLLKVALEICGRTEIRTVSIIHHKSLLPIMRDCSILWSIREVIRTHNMISSLLSGMIKAMYAITFLTSSVSRDLF